MGAPDWRVGPDGKVTNAAAPAAAVPPAAPPADDFDPDAYLAGKQAERTLPSSGMVSTAQIGAVKSKPIPQVPLSESIRRAAVQALPGGTFADEFTAAVKGALSDKPFLETYRTEREKERLANEQAFEANPGPSALTSGLTTLAGAFVAPEARLFSGANKAVKAGALAGGLNALGGSTADLTRGQVGRAALDTTIGSLFGAGGGALAKTSIESAPERVLARSAKGIVEGEESTAARKFQRKFSQRAGEDLDKLEAGLKAADPKLRKVLAVSEDPIVKEREVSRRIGTISKTSEPFYEKMATTEGGGIPVAEVDARMQRLVHELASKSELKMSDAMENVRQGFLRLHGSEGRAPMNEITARAVQNFKNDVASTAFATDPFVATPLKARAQRLAFKELDDTIGEAAKRAGLDHAALRKLNQEQSLWIPARDALQDRIKQERTGWEGLKTTVKKLGKQSAIGSVIGGIGGGPVGMAAVGLGANVAIPVAQNVARRVDFRLSRLVDAARAGNPAAIRRLAAMETAAGRGAGGLAGTAGTNAVLGPPAKDDFDPDAYLAAKAATP